MAHRSLKWSLLALLLLTGCGDCKSRVQSLFYKEVDRSVTPTQLRQQEEGQTNQEIEPNDTPEQATPIALQRDMGGILGAIDPVGDVDWFSLKAPEGEDWVVELTVTALDREVNLSIYVEVEGDHSPLLYDIAGPGEPESVPMLRVKAGQEQRFFIAGVDETTGNYRINVRRRLTAGAVAVEPNDHPHLASELIIPGEVQGFYDRPHDRDVFFVPAESLQAGVYSLEISHIPGLEQTLQIFGDESLESALMTISVNERRPSVIPNLSLHGGAEGGLYFVLSAGERFDRERGYRLRVIEHPPAQGFVLEREPNNTSHSAQVVGLSDRVRGYLHTPDDIDRFRFIVEPPADEADGGYGDVADIADIDDEEDAPAPVVAHDPWEGVFEKAPPSNVIQILLRPMGEAHRFAMRFLPGAETGEQSRELQAEAFDEGLVFCNYHLSPGEYDIELRSLETTEGFRPRSFDYELQIRNVAEMEGLEVEPNDSVATADRLKVGQERVGFISYEGDVDYFAFVVGPDGVVYEDDQAQEGLAEEDEDEEAEDGVALAGPAQAWEPPAVETVRVRLRGNRLNLGFELLDDEGGRVAQVRRSGPGGDEELTIDLPHGLYYLAVSAASGSLCEPYRIGVTTQ